MPLNTWHIGLQYKRDWNNVAWTQPGGIGTQVYPQEVTGNSNQLSQAPYNELTGTFFFGCGHSADQVLLLLDYDYTSGQQVSLICCPLCSFVQRTLSPAEAYNTLQNAVLTP